MSKETLFCEAEVLEVMSSRTNNGTFYRAVVKDLETGDEFTAGFGKSKPSFTEGAEISFEFDETDEGYINAFADSVEVLKEGKPAGRGRGGSTRGNSGGSRSSGGRGQASSSGGGRNSSRSGGRGGRGSSNGGTRGGRSGGSTGGRSAGGNNGSKGSSDKDAYWAEKAERDIETQKRIELQASRNTAIEFIKIAVDTGAITLPAKKGEKLEALELILDDTVARFLDQNERYIEEGAGIFGEGGEHGEDEE